MYTIICLFACNGFFVVNESLLTMCLLPSESNLIDFEREQD